MPLALLRCSVNEITELMEEKITLRLGHMHSGYWKQLHNTAELCNNILKNVIF